MAIGDWFRRRRPEQRSEVPISSWLSTYAPTSDAGVTVSQAAAMRVNTVHACVSLISKTIASLPLYVYREDGDSKTPARDHPLWAALHNAPNARMTSFTWREIQMAHLLLWGNAYSHIQRDAGAVHLVPLMPWDVTPRLVAGSIVYDVKSNHGDARRVLSDDMVHVVGLGFDGVCGCSPITEFARNWLGVAIASDQHAARTFANGARPGGVLEHPGRLGPDAAARLRDQWTTAYGGSANAGKTAVLEEGMKFHPVTMTSEDAQLLESRKFSVEQIATAFGVPPHKVGSLERATFSNIEHQAIEFVTDCIRPWVVRIEQELSRKLTLAEDGIAIEFKLDGLLRGDVKSRFEAYAIGRQNGWLSANDVRRLENLNPIENGDQYLVPVNMTTPAKLEAMPEDDNQDEASDEQARTGKARRLRAV